MASSFTRTSEDEYRRIRSGSMTPAKAAEYLRDQQIPLRRFGDVLREMYPHPDLSLRVASLFAESGTPMESAKRKVSNWLSSAYKPSTREDVYRVAFALDLSEDQVSQLLGMCTDYGINYRNGRDLVYAWCLRSGRGYHEAQELYRSMPPVPATARETDSEVTHRIRLLFEGAETEADLRRFYQENLRYFGSYHLRAYYYFEQYMHCLTQPDSSNGAQEEFYSLERVMSVYLPMHMPSGADRQGYSHIQKLIKRNWPNATSLKNIMARRQEVPRKLLLLLYIITENSVGGEYSELDEDYMTLENRLDGHWWSVNAMLSDCGMPELDPRNAFDWLVLYALTATGDESMSERMEKVIDILYEDVR